MTIELYTASTSNGQRAAIMLDECGYPYTVHKIDLFKGEQHAPAYAAINPSGAIPAMVDSEGPGGKRLVLAQSGAIMLYLAEKSERLVPRDPAKRAMAMQWLMQALTDTARASSALFLSSVLVPDKSAANVTFFEQLTLRYLRLANDRLAQHEFLADELSIADFALYPVVVARRAIVDAAGDLSNLVRWSATLATRPGVNAGMQAAA